MKAARVCAALAVLASVAIPLFVKADPPQSAAAGPVLSAGTPLAVVLDDRLDSSTVEPGASIRAHLRAPLMLDGRTLAPAGAPVSLIAAQTRRASPGVDGAVYLRIAPLSLAGGAALPLALPHYFLSQPLIAVIGDDVTVPRGTPPAAPLSDLMLPAGTILRATTAARVQIVENGALAIVTPGPFALSTDRAYSAFTPIPLTTYDPVARPSGGPRGRRGGRGGPPPSPSPSPTPADTPSPQPSAAPTP